MRRLAEVAGIPLPVLRGLSGAAGCRLHGQAQGIDPRAGEPRAPPQSVSIRSNFDPPGRERALLPARSAYWVEGAAF